MMPKRCLAVSSSLDVILLLSYSQFVAFVTMLGVVVSCVVIVVGSNGVIIFVVPAGVAFIAAGVAGTPFAVVAGVAAGVLATGTSMGVSSVGVASESVGSTTFSVVGVTSVDAVALLP